MKWVWLALVIITWACVIAGGIFVAMRGMPLHYHGHLVDPAHHDPSGIHHDTNGTERSAELWALV